MNVYIKRILLASVFGVAASFAEEVDHGLKHEPSTEQKALEILLVRDRLEESALELAAWFDSFFMSDQEPLNDGKLDSLIMLLDHCKSWEGYTLKKHYCDSILELLSKNENDQLDSSKVELIHQKIHGIKKRYPQGYIDGEVRSGRQQLTSYEESCLDYVESLLDSTGIYSGSRESWRRAGSVLEVSYYIKNDRAVLLRAELILKNFDIDDEALKKNFEGVNVIKMEHELPNVRRLLSKVDQVISYNEHTHGVQVFQQGEKGGYIYRLRDDLRESIQQGKGSERGQSRKLVIP